MITKAQARAYQRRWKAVNDAEREELRSTPVAIKARQLAVLMAAAKEFRWTKQEAREEAEVRRRWNRPRRFYVGIERRKLLTFAFCLLTFDLLFPPAAAVRRLSFGTVESSCPGVPL